VIIYPAIDLRNGYCIRLYQGDYARETVYSKDPVAVAETFARQGATWLHVVDLDGAKKPAGDPPPILSELLKCSKLNIQTGGGIRSKQQISTLLEQGAKRVIIGSLAVQEPQTVLEWLHYFGHERLVLALDIKYNAAQQAMLATHAWQRISHYTFVDLIRYYQSAELKHVLCTNIDLDGTLQGPDIALYDSILREFPLLKLQASGGIRSLADIQSLQRIGVAGAIIGRALYENKFHLSEAIAC
jgi:phosphoribosylformimino-5-aminoimidazole carboxamide ribotide isomerase